MLLMPNMRGFEAVPMFSQAQAGRTGHVGLRPAITSGAPDFLRITIELGAACFRRKPLTPVALLTAVNQCLTN